jgi:hypothetical protein
MKYPTQKKHRTLFCCAQKKSAFLVSNMKTPKMQPRPPRHQNKRVDVWIAAAVIGVIVCVALAFGPDGGRTARPHGSSTPGHGGEKNRPPRRTRTTN